MIRKSLIDKAEYRHSTLKNNVRVLTVSEPGLDKCSCALSVRTGSFDNPESIQGLAHFLEHMLFMGTEKYPRENELFSFLSRNGGSSNAYTSSEVTVYYFDVSPEAFREAIGIFSEFFKKPLFLKNTVEREISAVNSEFLNGLENDEWRNFRMRQHFSKKDHPANKFTVGNNRTLRKDNIWSLVREFWESKYKSKDMCVVIYGSEKSEVLEEYSRTFEEIPEHHGIERSVEELGFGSEDEQSPFYKTEVFDESFLNREIRIRPIKEQNTLLVSTVLPSEYRHFRNNPYLYLSHMFSREDKDGFILQLKDEGLAFSASFSTETTIGYTAATIEICLTERGGREYKRVLKHLREYFLNVRITEEEYYKVKEINECLFMYAEKMEPCLVAEKLAECMQFYPVEHVLDHEYTFEVFQRDFIEYAARSLGDYRSWLVFCLSKEGSFAEKEEFYNIEYSVGETIFAREMLKEWITVSNTSIIGEEEKKGDFRIETLNGGKITYLFDDSYGEPKAHLFFLLRMEKAEENMYEYYILLRKAEDTFYKKYHGAATSYQVSIDFDVLILGIEVRIRGFSYGIASVAKLFFEVLFGAPDASRFEVLKEELRDEFLSEKHNRAFRLLPYGMDSLLVPGFKLPEERLEMLEGLKEYVKMPTSFYLEVLGVGNIRYEDVLEVYEFVRSRQSSITDVHSLRYLKGKLCASIRTADDKNNACGLYYPTGEHGNYREVAMAFLLLQTLEEMFFDQLRTKEELGYIVYARVHSVHERHYLAFVVQSHRDADFLEKRIRKFVADLKEYFETMDDETFNEYRNSAICYLKEEHKNLSAYSSFLWGKYLCNVVDIAYKKKVAELARGLTKKDLMDVVFSEPYVVKAFKH
jgi:insulysin